jgi:hypothetical protein
VTVKNSPNKGKYKTERQQKEDKSQDDLTSGPGKAKKSSNQEEKTEVEGKIDQEDDGYKKNSA